MGLADQVVSIIALSVAVATIAITCTKTKISKPVRQWITKKSTWFGDLVSCPYCFGHWVSFVAVAAVRPVVTDSGVFLLDLFVSAMVVTGLSALLCGLIFKAVSSMG